MEPETFVEGGYPVEPYTEVWLALSLLSGGAEHMAKRLGCFVKSMRVEAGPVRMELELGPPGWASSLLRLRPRFLRELPSWIAVEDAVLRPLVAPWIGARGVRTRGVTAAGAREWYAIHDLRPIAVPRAWVDGADLGPTVRAGPAGFGFSEFPVHPALVRVTALFEAQGRPRGRRFAR